MAEASKSTPITTSHPRSRGTEAIGTPGAGGSSNMRRVASRMPATQRHAVNSSTTIATVDAVVKGPVFSSRDRGTTPPRPSPVSSRPGMLRTRPSTRVCCSGESVPRNVARPAKKITSRDVEAKSSW
ncbi:hypothetical protein KVA01_05210 [Kocuria varians]|uniref:Uncharacterized protein n=1 Tax=Kocuria varians TaxID=1272 RepID=A0A4Y4D198_KOCVA|nr:hypothetical protein KVA01_05210 [Kocuria varians]